MSIWTILKSLKNSYPTFTVLLQAKKYWQRVYVLKLLNKFEMKTMKDYHDFYLKSDVSFLAAADENLVIKA